MAYWHQEEPAPGNPGRRWAHALTSTIRCVFFCNQRVSYFTSSVVLHPFGLWMPSESVRGPSFSKTYLCRHTHELCLPFQRFRAPGWNGAETWAPAPLLTFRCWLVLVQGLKDLVWLPIEQYRKDGRIVRGFQRGAASFGTSTAMAALELTNRMVQTIQVPFRRLPEPPQRGRVVVEPFFRFVL